MPAIKKRILVAAGEDCISAFSFDWLISQGYYCERAGSDHELLDALRIAPYDMLVLDIHFDCTDLSQLLNHCFTMRRHMGLVALGADNESLESLRQYPIACSFLAPPYEYSRLLTAVHDMLEECLALDRHIQLETSLLDTQNRFSTLLESIPDAFFDLDRDGYISQANRQAETLFGRSLPELNQLRIDDLLVEGYRKQIRQYLDLLKTPSGRYAQDPNLHLMAVDRSGKVFPIDMRLTTLDHTSDNHIVCIVRDTTALQHASNELRSYQQKLEHRIEQRSRELMASKRELQGLYDSMTYDLNIPLRKIHGFCEILLEDCAAAMDGTVTEYVGRIRSSTLSMSGMIEDYVKQSRQLQGNLRRGPVDLSALAHEVMQHIIDSHPEQQIRFNIADECLATGDEQLIRILLEHLLDNARKFSSHERCAEISFGCKFEGNQQIFFVSDKGIGFDMQQAKRLFRPFTRLHLDSDFHGTGMGLASVRRIIDRHGGSIWADSRPNQGACFYFTLSQRHQDAPDKDKPSDIGAHLARRQR